MIDVVPYFDVATPATKPEAYDPAWRHRAAVFALRFGREHLPLAARSDPAVHTHIAVLRACAGLSRLDRFVDTPMWGAVDAVRRAREGAPDTLHFLNALLLTDAPYQALADTTGMSVAGIRYYELMYYNCRDVAGQSHLLPCAARIAWANGGRIKVTAEDPDACVWAYTAVNHGLVGMQALLGLPGATQQYATTMFRTGIMATLAGRMIVGNGKNFDMAALWKTANDGAKSDKADQQSMRGRGYSVLLEFLQLFKPALYSYEERALASAGGAAGAAAANEVGAAIDATVVTEHSTADKEADVNAGIRAKMRGAANFKGAT